MWAGYIRTFLATAAGLLVAAVLFVLVLDPYGASPIGLPAEHELMDINQRYMYPQLIRAGGHDSLVIGTSTSRLLQPADLNRAFGGRFANLAVNDARAWEQYRLFDLFERTSGAPRTLVVGLDRVWCEPNADEERFTQRGFPDWLYGDRAWPALLYYLNFKTVEIAGRRVGHWLGREEPRYDADGYGDFTGGEQNWRRATAEANLWPRGRHAIVPVEPPFVADETERAAWRFPALGWLEEILSRSKGSRVILAFMPVHITEQPVPGSREAARERECKRRVEALAGEAGAAYLDLRVPSEITTDDSNYWDRLHWRIGVGPRIIEAMAEATPPARSASVPEPR